VIDVRNQNHTQTTSALLTRLFLDGVPRIGFDIHLSPFPGSLYAILDYLGDKRPYDYLMGVTGAAFRRLWNRDDGGNVDLSYLGERPFHMVFDALGYGWHSVPPEKEAMRRAYHESLSRGVPVISFGILGPPEAGIVAGYEPDRDILHGWSYFQPDGGRYYEKSDWFETMENPTQRGLIVIDGKQSAGQRDYTALLATLPWAIELERTSKRPDLPDHLSGLAAYDGWADALEVDADYPPGDEGVMQTRTMIHGDQCLMLEERHEAARFLRRMADAAPQAHSELEAAAVLYDAVGDMCQQLWPWPVDSTHGANQALRDGATRRALTGYVREAARREAHAVEHLERAEALLN
jgi:hypothetical protein